MKMKELPSVFNTQGYHKTIDTLLQVNFQQSKNRLTFTKSNYYMYCNYCKSSKIATDMKYLYGLCMHT